MTDDKRLQSNFISHRICHQDMYLNSISVTVCTLSRSFPVGGGHHPNPLQELPEVSRIHVEYSLHLWAWLHSLCNASSSICFSLRNTTTTSS